MAGLDINIQKTKSIRMNTRINTRININKTALEEVNKYIYLGSKMTKVGDSMSDVNTRFTKRNQAFAMLRPVWRVKNFSQSLKICIFQSNVLSVLLYVSQCWKITVTIAQQLETCKNETLQRTLRIYWPNIITTELHKKTDTTTPLSLIVKKRR